MKLPPRWVRRLVLQPLFVVVTAAVTMLSPLLLIIAAAASPFVRGRWRPLRVALFTIVWMQQEVAAIVACIFLWLMAPGRLEQPQSRDRHYRLMRWFLRSARVWGERILDVTVSITDDGAAEAVLSANDRPLVVLSRHSGPGDTFYLVDMLLDRYGREPRVVMKEILELDPCIDLAGNRVPNYFVPPVGRRHGTWETRIAELSRNLGPRGALLLFPEGGNFTEQRRRRRLQRLLRRGRRGEAARAAGMHHVIAPEPGGALTALNAAPGADVILIAHGGLSGMRETGGLFSRAPIDQVFRVHLWHVPRTAIPEGEEAQRRWLLDGWQRIDSWIAQDERDGEPALRRA